MLLACTRGEGVALAYVRSDGVSSASHCSGGSTDEGDSLAFIRSVGVGFAATGLEGTKGVGAAVDSVCLVGVGSGRHCCGWHDR
jgi:hypothetical protein